MLLTPVDDYHVIRGPDGKDYRLFVDGPHPPTLPEGWTLMHPAPAPMKHWARSRVRLVNDTIQRHP